TQDNFRRPAAAEDGQREIGAGRAGRRGRRAGVACQVHGALADLKRCARAVRLRAIDRQRAGQFLGDGPARGDREPAFQPQPVGLLGWTNVLQLLSLPQLPLLSTFHCGGAAAATRSLICVLAVSCTSETPRLPSVGLERVSPLISASGAPA